MSQKPKVVERRWIILAQDGRHVTMGHAAPPSEAEVAAAAAALAAQGLAGWLAAGRELLVAPPRDPRPATDARRRRHAGLARCRHRL